MATVSLTIDGQAIEIEEGATILDAARQLGIHIPTLCHVPRLEAATSCFLCAVQIEGRRTLSPSCAMPVAAGMRVVTASEDVRQARRVALELLLSDHAGECVAPCQAQCPAGLEVPKFIPALALGHTARAMEVITSRLALPGALGRVCPHWCEQDCRRGDHDQALSIAALHRHAADADARAGAPYLPSCAPESSKSVAIVGAGPAGLAAAWFLRQRGHRCVVFDAAQKPGGMLRYGIPAYRLPKDALDTEIDAVRRLGVEFRMERRWGRDFTLADLRREHDAVFLAIGAQRAQELRCEGEELALSGVEFLSLVAHGNTPELGNDVIVLGGGNTAMDCARSARRLGATNVRVLYRRTRREMPCLIDEVEAAEAEGIRVDYLVAPLRVDRNGHDKLVLTCQRTELGAADASGRRQAVPVAGSEFAIGCSTVIAALGQTVDRSAAEQDGLRVTGWGIAADERTLATNLPGVFAGGDAVLGADLAVRAVAGGRLAAASIDKYLRGEPISRGVDLCRVGLRPIDDLERAEIFRGIERSARLQPRTIPMERRLASFDEVDEGLADGDARREARRCLSCGCGKAECCELRDLATEYSADASRFAGARRRFSRDTTHPEIVYEPGKCIVCDACVRIAAAEGEPLGVTTVGRGFDVAIGVPFDRPLREALTTSARRCAESCPTGALTLRPRP